MNKTCRLAMLRGWLMCGWLLLLCGCPTGETPTTTEGPTTGGAPAAGPADDAAAVAALEALSAKLARDDGGHVIEVNFRDLQIDDAALAHLAGLPQLRSVLLNKTAVTDQGLATLGQIETLENLDLRGCATTNDGVAHLAGLAKLRGLRLSTRQAEDTSDLSGATSYVDDGAMASIGQLTNLEVLALDNLFVTEIGLAELASLTKLKELYLAGTS
ncbi:MAG: hypothetical protein KDA41_01810, partial [Planctomycetales bacterium]|nr:hypothetical protein [Planctomycetales bacterium]